MSGSTGETGSLGNHARVFAEDLPCQLNQRVGRFEIRECALETEFLESLIQTHYFYEQIMLFVTGTAQYNVSAGQVQSCIVAIPSINEQEAIAAFLDQETCKIDALVAEQERLIALLKEKRQAVISQAVTKGLNPNAPMKDSGIEWLGQVPAHWEVTRLGRVSATKCDGPFGSGLKSEHYTEQGVRVIRLQNIRMGHFDDTDAAFIDEEYCRVSLPGHDVEQGDLLIAGLGDDRNIVGRCCVAPEGIEPAMVKADCFRFRLFTQRALPMFMAMQLTAGSQFDAGMMSSGSTRSRIPLSVMATRPVALPLLAEQQKIVTEIEARARDFDTLITEATQAITLLRERRAALISAAVTGKIDVRSLALTKQEAA
jgi:type I restriction enzyme S subunit